MITAHGFYVGIFMVMSDIDGGGGGEGGGGGGFSQIEDIKHMYTHHV